MTTTRLPNPPTQYGQEYMSRLLNQINQQFRALDQPGPLRGTTLNLVLLPTSATGLRYGDVWLDPLTGELKLVGDAAYAGWRDLPGIPQVRAAGANDPVWSTYRNSIKQFKFDLGTLNEMWFEYHVNHDYKPASDLHIHVHWSQIVADASKVVKWYFDISYAKGYNQAPFSAIVTTSVVQNSSAVQYQHMTAEVQISAASPSVAQIDSDSIEVDGIILVRVYRDGADAADTLTQAPFLHAVDIHYQTDRVSTKNKAPNFYA